MANTHLTASIIAKASVLLLENELVMARHVYRGHEEDFAKKVNGYDVGESISVERPMDFTVRSGATMDVQDVTRGKFTMDVDTQEGVDYNFTSRELTMSINDLAEVAIKPAMVQLANSVDSSLMGLYKDVAKWAGTPGQTLNSNPDYAKGPEALDLASVPEDGRYGCLSPSDHWGLVGNQTTLLNNQMVGQAYRKGVIGDIAGTMVYKSQNVPTHTTGTAADASALTNGAAQAVTYATSKDTNTQSLITDGWGNAETFKQGDVITIADVYDVNSVTKATLSHLKQFVITADATSDGSGNATLTISPAAIASGAHQTVSADIGDGKAIVINKGGSISTGYNQNMIFRKNAFSLVMVPLINPPGLPPNAIGVATRNGITVRVIQGYDVINDKSLSRLDILYGVKTIDQRQAVRLSGTA